MKKISDARNEEGRKEGVYRVALTVMYDTETWGMRCREELH